MRVRVSVRVRGRGRGRVRVRVGVRVRAHLVERDGVVAALGDRLLLAREAVPVLGLGSGLGLGLGLGLGFLPVKQYMSLVGLRLMKKSKRWPPPMRDLCRTT